MTTPERLICLVTGANQGIGYEVAKSLATTSRGPNGEAYHVLLGSRDAAKGQKAVESIQAGGGGGGGSSITPLQLDVTDLASIQAAAALVKRDFGRLDVLVNNAGVLCQDEDVVVALRADLEVNVVGAAAVTEAFLPLLLVQRDGDGGAGGTAAADEEERRVVFVSSSMGSFAGAADPGSRYYRAVTGSSPLEYRVSKAALNMLMLEYWKRYGAEERCAVRGDKEEKEKKVVVRVWSADPGVNATNFMGPGRAEMARERGIQGPEDGARVVVGCVVGERDGLEGKVVGRDGVQPF
ncbi:NAD(P)-binding protein [Cryphonectria parasitica EP155]|uniref:NAD(P)-binding protein n=1 Tax=Cryphonectria parasitica (strain ATCC 38755 / EP155) TaxID=660469 RepID=A0A9P5CUQ9_CRYP1|nr:NAD(P)-binding protein [Cryphonectria parasitica EP155]KAF3770852.1 NAD(P)-binding protein [Cryphonectria parasitica EP155]